MAIFRIHFASGEKHDIEAPTPKAAGEHAASRNLGHIIKIKRVKEKSP